jgi:hypothetical protein
MEVEATVIDCIDAELAPAEVVADVGLDGLESLTQVLFNLVSPEQGATVGGPDPVRKAVVLFTYFVAVVTCTHLPVQVRLGANGVSGEHPVKEEVHIAIPQMLIQERGERREVLAALDTRVGR